MTKRRLNKKDVTRLKNKPWDIATIKQQIQQINGTSKAWYTPCLFRIIGFNIAGSNINLYFKPLNYVDIVYDKITFGQNIVFRPITIPDVHLKITYYKHHKDSNKQSNYYGIEKLLELFDCTKINDLVGKNIIAMLQIYHKRLTIMNEASSKFTVFIPQISQIKK